MRTDLQKNGDRKKPRIFACKHFTSKHVQFEYLEHKAGILKRRQNSMIYIYFLLSTYY